MVTFLADAIKKLRRVFLSESEQVHEHHKTLWRGMRNLEASDDFLAMDGGVEAAPMSTTSDLAVAARYAASKKSLLFKLKVLLIEKHPPASIRDSCGLAGEQFYPVWRGHPMAFCVPTRG